MQELVRRLKESENVLVMAGALCDRVDFDGKKLLDYAAEIAVKLEAPVAATGNTIIGLKERNVPRVKKMWAAEVINYLRYAWADSVSPKKPDLLVLVGYPPAVAEHLVSAVKDAETLVLDCRCSQAATLSFPDATSLRQWQQNLDELVQAL